MTDQKKSPEQLFEEYWEKQGDERFSYYKTKKLTAARFFLAGFAAAKKEPYKDNG